MSGVFQNDFMFSVPALVVWIHLKKPAGMSLELYIWLLTYFKLVEYTFLLKKTNIADCLCDNHY